MSRDAQGAGAAERAVARLRHAVEWAEEVEACSGDAIREFSLDLHTFGHVLKHIDHLTAAVGGHAAGVTFGHPDTARLDWLEQQARDAYANPQDITDPAFGIAAADYFNCTKGVSVVLTHGYADETIADTLREAIDAAIAKEGA